MAKAGERRRDQKRKDNTPRYEGQAWKMADKVDKRYGRARNDSGDRVPDVADTRVEAGGERAGMGRGRSPRKPKQRAKGAGGRAGGR